jgi:hypothetical protein
MSDFPLTRITEKKYLAIPSTALTANGTIDGLITVDSTYCFKVGQRVYFKQGTTHKLAKIQRVTSETQFVVIEVDKSIVTTEKLDMSGFTVGTTVELNESKRPVIDLHEIQRQVYEEEPTVALRNHLVDWLGRSYDASNPMPVQLSDGSIDIGTVNAELEVQLSHQNNVPDAGDVADSVQVGDGSDILEINPDGSINIKITGGNGDVVNTYAEANSVAASTAVTVASYTVPIGKSAFLNRVEFGGSNIGIYEVQINAVTEAKRRTWFNGNMSDNFDFVSSTLSGIELSAGDVVRLRVTNIRPTVGDFEGRIQVVET